MAAAAVVSSAAAALPCAPALPSKTTSEFSCTADASTATSPLRHPEGDESAAAPQGDTQETGQVAVLVDTAEATDIETFDGGGVKITNLQATMTSNRYVAGRLPPAPGRPVEDIILFSPDYLSIKLLPRVPKRNPVGVGLVTVPQPTVKDAETAPPGKGLQPARR
jgi:hypothetical protein